LESTIFQKFPPPIPDDDELSKGRCQPKVIKRDPPLAAAGLTDN
jgi:hypothetical protein